MRGHKSILMIVLVAGLGVMTLRAVEIANTQTGAKPASASDTPRLEHQTFTLPNGLEVILSEDQRLPMVAVNLWYHVGPANESPGRTGFAHLFEHMMFQGSKHVAADTHFKLLEAAGATRHQRHDRLRSHELLRDGARRISSSWRCGSSPIAWAICSTSLDQKALANQQDVVRNERRQSVENQPYGIADEALYQTLFPADASVLRRRHRLARRHPGGEARRREAVLQAVLRAEQRQPRDRRRLRTRPRGRWSRSTSARSSAARRSADHGDDAADHGREAARRSPTASSCRASTWPGSRRRSSSRATPTPISRRTILGGGKSSRLYKTLVYDKQIAQDVTASQDSLILGSVFRIEATARPGHTAEELEKAIDEELRTLVGQAARRRRVERARNTHRDAHHRAVSRRSAASAAWPIA